MTEVPERFDPPEDGDEDDEEYKLELSYEWQAAFPPPEMLRAYYDISPDAGSRIIGLAETTARHRRKNEHEQFLGYMGGLAVVVLVFALVIAGAVMIAWLVSPIGGIVFGLGTPITITLGRRIAGRREEDSPDEDSPDSDDTRDA